MILNTCLMAVGLGSCIVLAVPVHVGSTNSTNLASRSPAATERDLVSLGQLINDEWADDEAQVLRLDPFADLSPAADASASVFAPASAPSIPVPAPPSPPKPQVQPDIVDLTTKPNEDVNAKENTGADEAEVEGDDAPAPVTQLPIVEGLFQILGEDQMGRSLVKRGRNLLIEEPIVNGHQWLGAAELSDEDDEPFWR